MEAIVGITATCERLASFTGADAEQQAAEYIGTLPNAEDGIYYLDVIDGDTATSAIRLGQEGD